MLFQQLLLDLQNGKDVVLATIISRNGSAPRMTGARMIIYSDGKIFGTIGGGQLEARCMLTAKEVCISKEPVIKEFKLTGKDAASTDMICGGNQEVLIEYLSAKNLRIIKLIENLVEVEKHRNKGWLITALPDKLTKKPVLIHGLISTDSVLYLDQDDNEIHIIEKNETQGESPSLSIHGQVFDVSNIKEPLKVSIEGRDYSIQPLDIGGTVYIFGGGHVSQQLAKITKLVGFRTVVIDDREDFANQTRFPGVDEIQLVASFDHVLVNIQLDPSSYLVIVTRGHLHDHIVLSAALKTSAVYIGMIGSKRKVETIYQALMKDGYSRDELSKVYAPIGMRIDAESPEEIAVSIVAEMIMVRAKLLKN